jgi:hypothetical protein
MFAVRGAYPNASRAGKVIREPEPTTVLIVPAPMPARKSIETWKIPMGNYVLKSRYIATALPGNPYICKGFAGKPLITELTALSEAIWPIWE